jgi:hypothetical protein
MDNMLLGQESREAQPPPKRPLILKILVAVIFAFGAWQIFAVVVNSLSSLLPDYLVNYLVGNPFDETIYTWAIIEGVFCVLISWGLWKGNLIAKIIAVIAVLGGIFLAILSIVNNPVASLILLIVLPFFLLTLEWPSVSAFFSKSE